VARVFRSGTVLASIHRPKPVAKLQNKLESATMAPIIENFAHLLVTRQQSNDPDDSPPNDTSSQSSSSTNLSGGAIAGIVIGSIIGFFLLIWVLRSCGFGFGLCATPTVAAPVPPPREYYYEKPRRSRSTRRHSHRHHHHRHSSSSTSPPRRSTSRPLRPIVVDNTYDSTPRAPPATYVYHSQTTGEPQGHYASYSKQGRTRR
jgi:hypothetical protein